LFICLYLSLNGASYSKVLVISTLEFDQVCQELEAALMSELLRGLSQLSSSGWKKHYLPGKSYVE
jgi:hypothetical protein